MSLLDSLLKSVESAKAKTKSLFSDTVITISERSVYEPSTGIVTTEPVNQLVSIMVDEWEYGEINGESVRSDDLKTFSFDVSSDVREADQVLFAGSKYSVVRITPVMVSNKMVARYIQLRK